MKRNLLVVILMCSINLFGQDTKPGQLSFGVEQDVLPYVLSGYIVTGWMGRDFVRCRFSYAEAQTPQFMLQTGIGKDKVNAFGISLEYFFKENFEGWWLGPGVGFWTNNLESEDMGQAKNESVIFSFGGGYNYFITRWLYTSPWIALHTRVSGTDLLDVSDASYKPIILTPELSIKLGVKFSKLNRN